MVDLKFLPLHLQAKFKYNDIDNPLGDATGFIVNNGKRYLITNWHVVTGRNFETGECIDKNQSVPNYLKVWFHSEHDGESNSWNEIDIPLLNEDGNKLWIEHPSGRKVDIVAIPINASDEIRFYDLNLALAINDSYKVLHPVESVTVIGFPFGETSTGQFPIWVSGTLASDPKDDYMLKRRVERVEGWDFDPIPVFLIDSSVRQGLSGSPVITRRIINPTVTDPGQLYQSSYSDTFLGVYSGRISKGNDINIGMVWKPHTIKEIVNL